MWGWKNQAVIRSTEHGDVAGHLEFCRKGKRLVAIFRGIPYAKPPVGELRWKPPVSPDKWHETRDCRFTRPESLQLGADFMRFFESAVSGHGFSKIRVQALIGGAKVLLPRFRPRQSEDCLYLNVRTPLWKQDAVSEEKLLPVMVYFHGGDHHDGAGANRPYYQSHSLCSRGDVVLVTFNYRLGIFGNFTHPDLSDENFKSNSFGISGNYGVQDQIAVLQWVQKNIKHFGGNPNCVTIFGTSAGGESILYMMTSPLARGLFHRAISQSPANSVSSLLHLKQRFLCFESSEQNGVNFATRIVGLQDGQIERLRNISADELNSHYLADATFEPQPRQLFFPVIDGVILPKSPIEAFFLGEQANVPLLIGFNSDEGSLVFKVTTNRTNLRDNIYPSPVRAAGRKAYGDDADRLIDLYDPSWRERGETGCSMDQSYLCDRAFGQKVLWLALHHHKTKSTAGASVYVYTFNTKPPLPGQTVGAFHGAEVPFVFGAKPWFSGGGLEDTELSAAMVDYWTSFARCGNPNITKEKRVNWPCFDLVTFNRIILDHQIEVCKMENLEKYAIMHKHIHQWIISLRETRYYRKVAPLQVESNRCEQRENVHDEVSINGEEQVVE